MRIDRVIRLCLAAALMLTVACRKSSDDDDDGSSAGVSNPLAKAYPVGLVIASPFASNGSAGLAEGDAEDFETRNEATNELLDGEGGTGCAYSIPDINTGVNPSCYGPDIQFIGHPDDDGNTNSTCNNTSWNPSGTDEGCLPSGDLGLWTEEEDSEACVAAKMNYEIERVGIYADLAMKTQAMILCAANRAGVSLPTSSTAESIKDEVEAQLSGQDIGGDFVSITMALEDTVNDLPQYRVAFEFEADDQTIEVEYSHRQLDDNNDTFRGRAKILINPSFALNTTRATAIGLTYDTATEGRFEYQMTEADAPADMDDFFEEDYDLALPSDNNGFSWGIFNLDLETYTGRTAYAWIAGNTSENVRSFISDVEGEVGSREGCGYFGFGVDLDTLYDDPSSGWLDRMICNWAGPGHDGTRAGQQLVQQQCMRESSSGVMEASSSNVHYLPRNSCGEDEGANSSFKWRYDADDSFSSFSPTSHELKSISSLDNDALDIPTRPTSI